MNYHTMFFLLIYPGFEPRLDQTKKHSVIDHGFEPRLDQTKKHSVIDHGFEPRLGQTKTHSVIWWSTQRKPPT
jgi:hypothetical protein